MQSEPERELITPESFESFVLLSCDVTALDSKLVIYNLTYKRLHSYYYYYLLVQLRDAFLVSNCSFLFLTVYNV